MALGWHATGWLDADGHRQGPYQPWQLAGLVAYVAIVAVVAGYLARQPRRALAIAAAISASLTVVFSLEAASDPHSDGLWPIGAALLAAGSLLGALLCALLGVLAVNLRADRRA